MEGIDANLAWMLGVVSAMVVFGIAAVVGCLKNPSQSESDSHD